MNLLINEPPLQVLPSLANQVGLNEAILLQQLHFRSLISSNVRDGHKWVYKTYEGWGNEFPFWSIDTIRRAINKLEKEGYVISTSAYNKMKMDKTKWYRVNYEMCILQSTQNAHTDSAKCTDGEGRNAQSDQCKMHKAITKEIKSTKKEIVENDLDVASSVIEYLNEKAGKRFKAKSVANRKFINGRIAEGYGYKDFKLVIDVKVAQWFNDPQMSNYLRPSTLFAPTNFENYLNENQVQRVQTNSVKVPRPPQLDFGRGEE